MKLRIKSDSLRLRLTQTEVRIFSENGTVSETLSFGDGGSSIKYTLAVDVAASRITAHFDGRELAVLIPENLATEWTSSDLVGIEAADIAPRVLIEKDFTCLEPRPGEDESDMFPNPEGYNCRTAERITR